MTAHVACPCGWSQDVELRPQARVGLNQIIADHAREHVNKGEPYHAPEVRIDV